jgi:hypothetical protein
MTPPDSENSSQSALEDTRGKNDHDCQGTEDSTLLKARYQINVASAAHTAHATTSPQRENATFQMPGWACHAEGCVSEGFAGYSHMSGSDMPCMHLRGTRVSCACWTRAAVTSKGDELQVNILTVRIPDKAITTWRRSVMPNKRRYNPGMQT